MKNELVVLVDVQGNAIGTMEKMEAHRKGVLHLAFSIFIFNSNNEMLLQQRAANKYHSADLWTNTCCSHPRPNEKIIAAAHRRLQEEMGFDCELKEAFNFIYRAELDKNLIENEFDFVFIGKYDGEPIINKDEVSDWKYLSLKKTKTELKNNPTQWTEWFKIAFEKTSDYYQNKNIKNKK